MVLLQMAALPVREWRFGIVEVTKALALQDGVLLALELGVSHVIVESDALSIIQAINEGVLGGEIGRAHV